MKRVLVICGDAWHPAEIVRRGLAPLCADGFDFEYLEDDVAKLPVILPEFSIVLLAKANMISAADRRPWLTPGTEASFREFVKRGGGFVVIHAGTSRYETSSDMMEMIGGAFDRHPEPCAVTMEPQAVHPLVNGVASFTVRDEHYFMSMSGVPVDVFLHSRSEHGVQPAGWTRVVEGGGRIFALTPGHHLDVWLHPEFQKLLRHGMNWVAKLT